MATLLAIRIDRKNRATAVLKTESPRDSVDHNAPFRIWQADRYVFWCWPVTPIANEFISNPLANAEKLNIYESGSNMVVCSMALSVSRRRRIDNASPCVGDILMLPDSEYLPLGSLKAGNGLAISFAIVGQLASPIRGVCGGRRAMHQARVPEASIKKHG